MAGGMNRRSHWGSMAQRVGHPHSSPAATDAECVTEPSAAQSRPTDRIKHCWVVDEHGRLPGLLLEWRRVETGFQGRVVRPVEEPDIGWIVVEEWLAAECLEPT